MGNILVKVWNVQRLRNFMSVTVCGITIFAYWLNNIRIPSKLNCIVLFLFLVFELFFLLINVYIITGIQRSMDKRSSVKCCRAANWPRNIWASGMEFAYKNSSERGNNRTMASRYLSIVNLHRNVKLCSLPSIYKSGF